ncbi:hypothetical protein CCUS01_06147 [Colletotrichum cuscutae]|uniref:Uncharacterized protein n=1 Tax=Colletotrichum cuscutae TaxID=1209917 RepID=A0AAI9Y472_9PEZI|nr:hypothetical protein CCUS01_06147 [Colletotrichum cuscutae]
MLLTWRSSKSSSLASLLLAVDSARGRQSAVRSHKVTRRIITVSQAHTLSVMQMKQGFRTVDRARGGGELEKKKRNIRWLLQITGYLDLDRGSRWANASPRAQTFPKQLAQLLSSFAVAVEELHGMEGHCCAFSLR